MMQTLILLLTFTASACAQADLPAFEVATLRPAPPRVPMRGPGGGFRVGWNGGPGTGDPTRMSFENMNLADLMSYAYDLKDFQIVAPGVSKADRFNIVAKVPAGDTKEQVRLMLQSLLIERFKLKLHHEQKEMQVYDLVIAKNGHKMKESVDDPAPAKDSDPALPAPAASGRVPMGNDGYPVMPAGLGTRTFFMNGKARMRAEKESMPEFAAFLSNQLSKIVTDSTGLKSKYDFILSFAPEGVSMGPGDSANDTNDAPPPLIAAVQSQLGLKLESKKGMVDMLVVDHAEKVPTEN